MRCHCVSNQVWRFLFFPSQHHNFTLDSSLPRILCRFLERTWWGVILQLFFHSTNVTSMWILDGIIYHARVWLSLFHGTIEKFDVSMKKSVRTHMPWRNGLQHPYISCYHKRYIWDLNYVWFKKNSLQRPIVCYLINI